MTNVQIVYDAFFDRITDDMYLSMTEEEIKEDCFSLLLSSISLYEFPKKVIRVISKDDENFFSRDLTVEEINILATGMVEIWLQRQINSIELTRQKFTGQDFKQTSQAAHLGKLLTYLNSVKDEHRRLQMLESRRRINSNDEYESAFDLFVKPIAKGGTN